MGRSDETRFIILMTIYGALSNIENIPACSEVSKTPSMTKICFSFHYRQRDIA